MRSGAAVTGSVIHLFRQDLRLADNAALSAAIALGRPVIPVYILDQESSGPWAPGGASRWWLHHSLRSLETSLAALGSRLILRRGPAAEVVSSLAADCGAHTITLTRGYEPDAVQLEQDLRAALVGSAEVKRFGGNLLQEPESIASLSGRPYKVFTPFYKACLKQSAPRAPIAPPKAIAHPKAWPKGDDLADWGLLPRGPDWSGGLAAEWTPGEAGAAARLDRFLAEAMAAYPTDRDLPGRLGTSRLSPHLHFGEISPRTCWHRVQHILDRNSGKGDAGGQAFLRQIGWRDFSAHLLHHWPQIPDSPFKPEFAAFPWTNSAEALAAWQRGKTGYPIVDAGMRELWHSGWMHNRVRMIVASFLVKHLLIPWQAGEAWFWDTLVDADLANNAAGWQWVAGCGADAAPYFRIFNPILQGEKFDPAGDYVRRWVPELAALPDLYLHRPWEAPPEVLAQAGVTLGDSYPHPIVDHKAARARALMALQSMKA